MSDTELIFFSSGNSRKLTTNCNTDSWQQALHKLDQFIHSSNALSLASNDIVFQKVNGGLKISREITGFVSEHELAPLEIFVDDAVDRCCVAVGLAAPYETSLLDIISKADQVVSSLQLTDFPKDYGTFVDFDVRLRMNFKTIDQLNSEWLAYLFFDRTSSSILTF